MKLPTTIWINLLPTNLCKNIFLTFSWHSTLFSCFSWLGFPCLVEKILIFPVFPSFPRPLRTLKTVRQFESEVLDHNLIMTLIMANHDCLHYAIPKALYGFKVTRVWGKRFLYQNVQNVISISLKCFTAACWINSRISNRDISTKFMIFLCCHYCWSLLWCNYGSNYAVIRAI